MTVSDRPHRPLGPPNRRLQRERLSLAPFCLCSHCPRGNVGYSTNIIAFNIAGGGKSCYYYISGMGLRFYICKNFILFQESDCSETSSVGSPSPATDAAGCTDLSVCPPRPPMPPQARHDDPPHGENKMPSPGQPTHSAVQQQLNGTSEYESFFFYFCNF